MAKSKIWKLSQKSKVRPILPQILGFLEALPDMKPENTQFLGQNYHFSGNFGRVCPKNAVFCQILT